MKNSNLLKDAAQRTPVLGRILKEKRELDKLRRVQSKRIKNLEEQNRRLKSAIAGKSQIWPLLKREILKAELNKEDTKEIFTKHNPPYVISWVVPAVNPASGGQSDIFRTIEYLTNNGHSCQIYIFDPTQRSNLLAQKEIIHKNFPGLKSRIFYNSNKISNCDAIFATHWTTAYPVYNYHGSGKRYYYVQDFEPQIELTSYFGLLAERTYDFGFHGITLGEWLAEQLRRRHGMTCDYFDFGYNPKEYFQISSKPRKDILYYAQPTKARRGFELGLIALEIFHSKNPNSKIHLFGSELDNYEIPFPFLNHGVLTVKQLNELYNHCAAGLALSFTNMSLIPLEMIASGCRPVVNEAAHTKNVKYADMVIYAKPEATDMANALSKAVRSNPKGLRASLDQTYTWDRSNQRVEKMLIRDLTS